MQQSAVAKPRFAQIKLFKSHLFTSVCCCLTASTRLNFAAKPCLRGGAAAAKELKEAEADRKSALTEPQHSRRLSSSCEFLLVAGKQGNGGLAPPTGMGCCC